MTGLTAEVLGKNRIFDRPIESEEDQEERICNHRAEGKCEVGVHREEAEAQYPRNRGFGDGADEFLHSIRAYVRHRTQLSSIGKYGHAMENEKLEYEWVLHSLAAEHLQDNLQLD